MRPEFYEIYRDLITDYSNLYGGQSIFARLLHARTPASRNALKFAAEAISQAVSTLELHGRVRPDAELFLLVNLHQMIGLALTHPALPTETQQQLPNIESIRESVIADAREILAAARDEASGNEVSGHDIVAALPRVWDRLRTSALEVWG